MSITKNRILFLLVALWNVVSPMEGKEIIVFASDAGSLNQIIRKADTGDTLCFNSGEYPLDSTCIIDKSLVLMADGCVKIIAPEHQGAFVVRAPQVVIQGFIIGGVQKSYSKDLAAIWVDFSSDFQILDNQIDSCFFAIYVTKSKHGIIRGNNIHGNAVQEHSSANAIHLWYCDDIIIGNNVVKNHRDGIYLEFTGHSSIVGNYSENNLRYGLHFMFSNNNAYIENTFKSNGAGVAVMFSDHIQMTSNKFLDNWGNSSYGLLLKEIYDSRIEGNTFNKNTIGIFSEGCSRVNFHLNRFEANGWAIKMRGSSSDNILDSNAFIGNSFDIATDSKRNYNSYIHNYWDSYEGYDLNKDGLGDIPHRPMNLFSYLATKSDENILLMRSNFIGILNFSERLAPVLTPSDLIDEAPVMRFQRSGFQNSNKSL